MKKFSILAAIVVAAIMGSCTNSTPKANLKNDVDSLSYAFGLAQTRGLKEYLTQRMDVDTAYIDEFIKGLNESVNAGDNKKKTAYYAGLQIGQQISQQMIKGINYEVFGDDSTQTISLNNFMAGFVTGTKGEDGLMSIDEAAANIETMLKTVKSRVMSEKYGDWKKQCEDYMAEIAKNRGQGRHSCRHQPRHRQLRGQAPQRHHLRQQLPEERARQVPLQSGYSRMDKGSDQDARRLHMERLYSSGTGLRRTGERCQAASLLLPDFQD